MLATVLNYNFCEVKHLIIDRLIFLLLFNVTITRKA